jgi:hypothetical protein
MRIMKRSRYGNGIELKRTALRDCEDFFIEGSGQVADRVENRCGATSSNF